MEQLVYRVEHASHRHGPYTGCWEADDCGDLANELVEAHDCDDLRPAPWKDGIPRSAIYSLETRFAFASMSALEAWFADFLSALVDAGYRAHVYRVPEDEMIHGGHQLIFDHTKAELVDTLPL